MPHVLTIADMMMSYLFFFKKNNFFSHIKSLFILSLFPSRPPFIYPLYLSLIIIKNQNDDLENLEYVNYKFYKTKRCWNIIFYLTSFFSSLSDRLHCRIVGANH